MFQELPNKIRRIELHERRQIMLVIMLLSLQSLGNIGGKELEIYIKIYLEQCHICADMKSRASNVQREVRFIMYNPFSHFSMDMHSFPRLMIMLAIYFTKYTWLSPIKHKTAEVVDTHLRHLLKELRDIHHQSNLIGRSH